MAKGSYTAATGPSVNVVHVHRDVQYYSVTESELHDIGTLNTAATSLYSMATFFFSMFFSLWSGLLIEGSPPASGKITAEALQTVFIATAALLCGLAVWFTFAKRSKIHEIKTKSRATPRPPSWWNRVLDRMLPERSHAAATPANATQPDAPTTANAPVTNQAPPTG